MDEELKERIERMNNIINEKQKERIDVMDEERKERMEKIMDASKEEEKKTGVLSKLGRAFKKVASFIVRRETIEAAKEVSVFVPVAGQAMAIVLGLVEEAEEVFSEPGKGKEKLAWVLENALSVMAAAGYEEKRVNGLIELALLVLKLEARLIVDKPDDE